jgi:hypothetical protein
MVGAMECEDSLFPPEDLSEEALKYEALELLSENTTNSRSTVAHAFKDFATQQKNGT